MTYYRVHKLILQCKKQVTGGKNTRCRRFMNHKNTEVFNSQGAGTYVVLMLKWQKSQATLTDTIYIDKGYR